MENRIIIGGKIMEGYIRAQSVIFGDFSNYDIDSKSIYELMGEMKEFEVIPNVIDEIQIEITDNKPIQRLAKRVELNSYNNEFSITISREDIVIRAIPKVNLESNNSDIDIDKFIKNTKKIFDILLRVMNVKGNRVSLVTTYLDESNLNNQYENYAKPDRFFKNKDVFEWNAKSVIREQINELKGDHINIIRNISRLKGVLGSNVPMPNEYSFDGVLKEIDINTIPENDGYRIDSIYIDSFYDIALSRKNEIEGMGSDSE